MKELLEEAIILATHGHAGQTDKAGLPYILHPLTVMGGVQTLREKIVAVLHDVLEDTSYTKEQLAVIFGIEITESVVALTKRAGETYHLYIMRVKADETARKVKIEDIKHNMDLSRIPNPTKADYDRVRKYDKALRKLEDV